jgi:hypothetical protein
VLPGDALCFVDEVIITACTAFVAVVASPNRRAMFCTVLAIILARCGLFLRHTAARSWVARVICLSEARILRWFCGSSPQGGAIPGFLGIVLHRGDNLIQILCDLSGQIGDAPGRAVGFLANFRTSSATTAKPLPA